MHLCHAVMSALRLFLQSINQVESMAHSPTQELKLAMQGHHVPEHYNPAEFIADLIAVDPSSPAAEAASRCDLLPHRWFT